MTDWNPKNEQLIRDLGDFIDKQLRDVIDPKASTLGTSSRVAFNVASHGKGLFERAINELGIDMNSEWHDAMQKLVDLCEQNGSDAGAKIKKALPVAKQLAQEFGFTPDTRMGKLEMLGVLKKIKKKSIKFD